MFSAESNMKMNLQFVTMYRQLLKQLCKACHERPHYVQEIRLLLAKPLVELHSYNNDRNVETENIKNLINKQTETNLSVPETAISEATTKTLGHTNELFWRNLHRKATSQPRTSSSESTLMYLERPPSECWRVDREQLFQRCRSDLYDEIVHSLSNAQSNKCLLNVERGDSQNLQTEKSKDETHNNSNFIASKENDNRHGEKVMSDSCKVEQSITDPASKKDKCAKHEDEVLFTKDRNTLPLLAKQLIGYRELVWLRDRLAKVLTRATLRRLDQSLCVFDGPDRDNDFISDDYFDKKMHKEDESSITKSDNSQRQSDLSTLSKLPPSSLPSSHSPFSSFTESVELSPEIAGNKKERNEKYNQVRNDLYNERSGDEVYSAGALGLQREVFVLRHVEDFPLAKRFLSNYTNPEKQEKLASLNSLEELERFVHENVPPNVTCRNEEVEICVEVKPFDAKYTHKDQAGVGFFATAHRQFMVHFTLKPTASTNYIQIVNSYFARLDFHTGQLIEEVGYLHSSDVRRLLQERDVPFLYSTNEQDDEDDGTAGVKMEKSKSANERSHNQRCNCKKNTNEKNTNSGDEDDDTENNAESSAISQNEVYDKRTTQSTEGEDIQSKVGSRASREHKRYESTNKYENENESNMEESETAYIDLGSSCGEGDRDAEGNKLRDFADSSSNSHSRDFTLFFANMSDGANVLKGALYYKVGSSRSLMHEPIHVLSFGHVLLES